MLKYDLQQRGEHRLRLPNKEGDLTGRQKKGLAAYSCCLMEVIRKKQSQEPGWEQPCSKVALK
ncbi:hypothetical protein M9458_033164, partial [Cirrhinus mrigala]